MESRRKMHYVSGEYKDQNAINTSPYKILILYLL